MPLKRLLQIRLRTLLVIMFVAAIATIWCGHLWRENLRRQTAISYLWDRGATLRFMPSPRGTIVEVSFEWVAMLNASLPDTASAPRPQTAKGLFSDRLTLEDFEQLRQVPRLTSLSIQGITLTQESLAGIATLDGLERLDISHSSLDDKGLLELAPLTKLRELNLEATQVTDDGVARLTTALPNLVVNDD